jgi:hypothetical protein
MLSSDRGKKSASRLIRGGIIASIICAVIIVFGFLQAANYERQANDKRAEYSEYTNEKVAQTCIRMTAVERLKCVNEAFEAKRNYEANQYDLEAQRKSAFWAFIMGAAAVIGMALSAVGVWLVKTTFRETQQANVIARNAQRAWVTLKAKPEAIKRREGYGLHIRATFVAENIGGTAATEFDICHAVLFKGQTEKSTSILDRIDEHIEEWKADYTDMGRSYLLPKDTETSDIWDDFTAEQIQWWEGVPVIGKSAQPMLLCAVFYKTVDHPDIVQLSWRAWYLNTLDTDNTQMTLIPFNSIPLRSDTLCVDAFHSSLVHTEYRVEHP